jgi:hypothetical protein
VLKFRTIISNIEIFVSIIAVKLNSSYLRNGSSIKYVLKYIVIFVVTPRCLGVPKGQGIGVAMAVLIGVFLFEF